MNCPYSFHSTDCPSEWGLPHAVSPHSIVGVVSIQLIAPASGAEWVNAVQDCIQNKSFHSTDCPSEWGHRDPEKAAKLAGLQVSIQLIAPASGASPLTHPRIFWEIVSIQLIAPASGALMKSLITCLTVY